LQYAVARQQEAIVERLLQIPSLDVNQTNPKGETALMVAALIGNLNIARKLIAKGARVALKDEDGSTALDFAKASDSLQKNAMIKLLRDAKKSQRR
jgi:ankyrin repeat protein